jgi:hypothetical protein
MAKLPGGVCYWVRIYKYIRALKQSERERHCIAKTGFTPRSYNIIEAAAAAAAAKANIKKFFCSFASHNMSNNRP